MAKTKRAIAIIRVSKEGGRGDDLLSPDLQRDTITDYCHRRGLDVVQWVSAVDESGSQDRSAWWPRLDAAIEEIEAGRADAIVARAYSRFARQRLRWATAVDRVERAGGTIESATEGIDTTTGAGKFSRGILAEVAAYFADQVGESWKETHANRLARGLPANGKDRFGYAYDTSAKIHRPDPDLGPILGQVYRRYIAGESVYSLARWLNGDGIQTAPGYGSGPRLWSDRSLRRVMDSGFGAGLLSIHDPDCKCGPRARPGCPRRRHLPGAHEPVITTEEWATYLEQRRARSVTRSTERSQYLLSGMLRCVAPLDDGGVCGGVMTGGQFGHGHTPKFRCKRGREFLTHTGGYVTMSYVEDRVRTWVEDLAADLDAAAARAAATSASVAADLPGARRRLRDAEADLDQATRRYLADKIPERSWPGIRADLEARVATLEGKVEALKAARPGRLPEEIAASLARDWDTLPMEHRRGMLRGLIERVEITPGKIVQDDRGFWRSGVRIVPTS